MSLSNEEMNPEKMKAEKMKKALETAKKTLGDLSRCYSTSEETECLKCKGQSSDGCTECKGTGKVHPTRCFNCDEFMDLAVWPEHGNPKCIVGLAIKEIDEALAS